MNKFDRYEEEPQTVEAKRLQDIRQHIHRYFVVVYGEDYVYRAPETYPHGLERWMLGIARGDDSGMKYAEKQMQSIEKFMKEHQL